MWLEGGEYRRAPALSDFMQFAVVGIPLGSVQDSTGGRQRSARGRMELVIRQGETYLRRFLNRSDELGCLVQHLECLLVLPGNGLECD
jgi:hypothetical protein